MDSPSTYYNCDWPIALGIGDLLHVNFHRALIGAHWRRSLHPERSPQSGCPEIGLRAEGLVPRSHPRIPTDSLIFNPALRRWPRFGSRVKPLISARTVSPLMIFSTLLGMSVLLSTKNIKINASNRGEKARVCGNLAGDQISKARS